jgi:hypothetical protein
VTKGSCMRTGWGNSRKTLTVLQQADGKDFRRAGGGGAESNNLQDKKKATETRRSPWPEIYTLPDAGKPPRT